MGAFFVGKSHKNRGGFLKISRNEVFNKLTENGKYTGVYKNEYNGRYLGLGFYIVSGNLKMKHAIPEKIFYDSWREMRCKKLNRFEI